MHANSLELFRHHGLPLLQPGDSVLEIGPDWSVPGGRVKPLIVAAGCDYAFADIKNPPGGVHMDGPYRIYEETSMYDAVVALNVAEHVFRLWDWVAELRRVTRPDGLLIFANPVSWPYHESPMDCWRIYPDGWRALFCECDINEVFLWHGNLVPLEGYLRAEHGPHEVRDTIAVGRKPS
jgi:SAM-dependent methyltransferase